MGNIVAKHKIQELIQTSDPAALQQCMQLLQQQPTLATDRMSPRPGTTLWHLAAGTGSPAALIALLDFVAGPTSPWAALPRERMEARRKLLLDDGNAWGLTPMSIACAVGDDVSTALLLSLGASCFCKDSNGMTAAHHAAREGHVQCLRTLLDCEQNVMARRRLQDVCNVSGLAPLHYAVAKGHLHCVQQLLESGAGLAPRSRTFTSELGVILPAGSTPLHVAARLGLQEVVVLMLRHHATERRAAHAAHDIRLVQDDKGHTPASVANTRAARQATVMLHMLEPEADLLHMFSVQELALPVTGIVRLSIIAAAALQTKLLTDLQRPASSSGSTPPTPSRPPPAAPGDPPGATTSGLPPASLLQRDLSPDGRSPQQPGPDPQPPPPPPAAPAAAPGPSPETCALCLSDAVPDLEVGPCGHALCSSCAMQLVIRVVDKPPVCPFCRSRIAAFLKVHRFRRLP